jgi:rubrerythrin
MVTGLSIETLLPRTSGEDGYIQRFLAIWTPDEQGHARALEHLLQQLELEPFPLPTEQPVPIHNRLAGLLGTLSARMHQTVELMYHTVGAMNERLAFSAYERMAEILTELGEHGLVETLMKPLRRDESAHLGYYRTAARDLRDRCDRFQLAAARNILVHTYAPVGAGDKRDKPAFARTLESLGDFDLIVDKVQLIAESLLSADERRLPPFVAKSFDRCAVLL